MRPNLRPHALGICCLGLALAASSCSSDVLTSEQSRRATADLSTADTVWICHLPGIANTIEAIPAPSVAPYLAAGDYITTLFVSRDPGQPADGAHFRRISDALTAARTGRLARGEQVSAGCRITIIVADGVYQGTAVSTPSGDVEQFPIVVDVPAITLRGALVMGVDAAGRATGQGVGPASSTLTPLEPLPVIGGVSTPIIIANAHPGGSAGNSLIVQGFVLQSGHNPAVDAGGQGVFGARITGLTIFGNRFEAGFTESIDLRSVTAQLVTNHLAGTAANCDMCLAGPGAYQVVGNTLLAGGIPGILVAGSVGLGVPNGVEPLTIPTTAVTSAQLVNNAISDHNRTPVGSGIRLDALGSSAPNVQTTIHASIVGNLLVNNRFGIIMHAGMTNGSTVLRGDMDATLSGNIIQQSCETALLVAFTRSNTTLGLASNPYLHNSTYKLTLVGDPNWSTAWFDDPAGLGNKLIVNGLQIANGTRQFYDATGCPGR